MRNRVLLAAIGAALIAVPADAGRGRDRGRGRAASIAGLLAVCGDGLIGGAEGCDDGGTAAGDGCSATCTIESSWTCAGEPSFCTRWAVDLDGTDDRVDRADEAALDPTTQFTVRIWLESDSYSTVKAVVSKFTASGTQGSWRIDTNANNDAAIRLVLCTSATCGTFTTCRSHPGALITGAVQRHIVAVYDGTQATVNDRCRVFLNGADVSVVHSGTHPTTLADSTSDFAVGTNSAGTSTNDVDGRVDEVVYDVGRAWTAAQVFDDFCATAATCGRPRASLVGAPTLWWRMGENDAGTGTQVTDASGNARHGTLRNQAAFTTLGPPVITQPSCASNNRLYQVFPILAQSNFSGRGTLEGAGFAERFVDATQSWTSELTDYDDADSADVQLFPTVELANDAFAFGSTRRFARVIWDYAGGTAGAGGVVAWEYCSANSDPATACDTWSALTGVNDATSSFTAAAADGRVTRWTVPSDWALSTADGSGQLYLGRARITTIYTTNPIVDQGWVAHSASNGDRIYMYGNDELFTSWVGEPHDSANGQVDTVSSDPLAAHGPAVAFASDLASDWTNHRIVLVPCELGGTLALDWTPGSLTASLMGSCITRVSEAITAAGGGTQAEVGGILVYQAEADSAQEYRYQNWARRWRTGLERFRASIGQTCAPAVVVQLPTTEWTGGTFWTEMRAEIDAFPTHLGIWDVALAQAPSGPYVSPPSDFLHLERSALDVLGPLVSTAYQTTRYAGLVTP